MIQNIVYHRFLYGIPLCLSHGGDHCVYRCLLCHKAAVPIEFGIYIIRVGPLVDRLSQQIKEILLFFLACGSTCCSRVEVSFRYSLVPSGNKFRAMSYPFCPVPWEVTAKFMTLGIVSSSSPEDCSST
jgi:hypothetical protein